jgi:hypothetical protein
MEKREDIIRRLAEKLPAEALQKMVAQFVDSNDGLLPPFLSCCRKNGLTGTADERTMQLHSLLDVLDNECDFLFDDDWDSVEAVMNAMKAIRKLGKVSEIPWELRKFAIEQLMEEEYQDLEDADTREKYCCSAAVHLALNRKEAAYVAKVMKKADMDLSDRTEFLSDGNRGWYEELMRKLEK